MAQLGKALEMKNRMSGMRSSTLDPDLLKIQESGDALTADPIAAFARVCRTKVAPAKPSRAGSLT